MIGGSAVLVLLLCSSTVYSTEPETTTNTNALPEENGSSFEHMECLQGDSLTNPVLEEVKEQIRRGERDFSVNLIKSLFKDGNQTETGEETNIFISPSSIYQALTLSHFGARGKTKDDLEAVMGMTGISSIDVMKNYLFDKAFQSIRERNPELGYNLTHANKFYFNRDLSLDPCLQKVLSEEMEATDFSNSNKATRIINSWVERKTNKKIRDLIPSGSLDGSTKVALVNAAYFKGEWESRFNMSESKKDNFYTRRDKIAITKFMKQKGKFNYYVSEELRAHILELPYKGEQVSMLIILPPFEEGSLQKTINLLSPETFQGVIAEVKSGFYQIDDLSIKIPKFRIEESYNLGNTLGDLGVQSLFAADSDLSGFLADKSNEVKLNRAIHKAFIEVNEEGTEAAASTAIFAFRSASPLFHKNFNADHPFLFMIYDKEADVILFFGVYQNPDPSA
uniref:Serpin B4 n=1 Tax=Caligus clemensi TaxID=344056 RepID=C1C0L2_CALCM|nr:Serpin B4 [Caligus clemensi]